MHGLSWRDMGTSHAAGMGVSRIPGKRVLDLLVDLVLSRFASRSVHGVVFDRARVHLTSVGGGALLHLVNAEDGTLNPSRVLGLGLIVARV